MLRCSWFAESGKPPAPGRGRRPPAERADTPDTRTAETPPACSQRLTRGVAPHAQTPKSRRSVKTVKSEENPSLFGFLLGTRDAGVDLPRTNFGGPCPEPQRPGGSLDPESRGPLGRREGHFRYRHVPHSPRHASWRSLGRSETVHAVVMLAPRRIWGRAPVRSGARSLEKWIFKSHCSDSIFWGCSPLSLLSQLFRH